MSDAANEPSATARILGRESVAFDTSLQPTLIASRPYVELEHHGADADATTYVLQSIGPDGPDGQVEEELVAESTEGAVTVFRAAGFFPDTTYRIVERVDGEDLPVTEPRPKSEIFNRRSTPEASSSDDDTSTASSTPAIHRTPPAGLTVRIRLQEPEDATLAKTTGGCALVPRDETPYEEMTAQQKARAMKGEQTPPDRSGYQSVRNQWVYLYKRARMRPAPGEGSESDDGRSHLVYAREFWVDMHGHFTETAHHALGAFNEPGEIVTTNVGAPGAQGKEPVRVEEEPPPARGARRTYISVEYSPREGEAPDFFFWSSDLRIPMARFHQYGISLLTDARTPPFVSVSFQRKRDRHGRHRVHVQHGHTFGSKKPGQIVTEEGTPFTGEAALADLWGASVTLPSCGYMLRKRGARVLAALDRWGRWSEEVADASLLSRLVDEVSYSETQGRSSLQKILREADHSLSLFSEQYAGDITLQQVKQPPTPSAYIYQDRTEAEIAEDKRARRLHERYYQDKENTREGVKEKSRLPDTLLRHWVTGYEEKGKQLINEIAAANAGLLQLLKSRPVRAALGDLEASIEEGSGGNAGTKSVAHGSSSREADANKGDEDPDLPDAVKKQVLMIAQLFRALTLVEAHRKGRQETPLKSFSELHAEGYLPEDSFAGSSGAGCEDWSLEEHAEVFSSDVLGDAYEGSSLYDAVESLNVSIDQIEQDENFTGDEFLNALRTNEDRGARSRPAIAPSDLIGTIFKVVYKSRKIVPSAFNWSVEALGTLIARMHKRQANAALAVQQLANIATRTTGGVAPQFALRVDRRRIANESVRQVQVYLSTADAEQLFRAGNTVARVLDSVNIILIATATGRHFEKNGITDPWTVMHGFRTGVESARLLLTEARIEKWLRTANVTITWSDEAVAALSKSLVRRGGIFAGAISAGVDIIMAIDALKDEQVFAAAGHGLFAASSLVFMKAGLLSSFLGVIGVAFFLGGGAFILIQAWVNSQKRLGADPLSEWLPEGCVWGERYGAYKPPGAQEAVVPPVSAVAELNALFGLLSETWTGDSQSEPATAATLSTTQRERITGQIEAFMENAFSFPSTVRGIEKLGRSSTGAQVLDTTMLRRAVEGRYEGGSINMRGLNNEDPDVRYLQGLELRIRPEYLPKIGTLEVDLVARKNKGVGIPLRCIVHYVLDPKEDDTTYRYVVVGSGDQVPLYGDGEDLMSSSRLWPTTRNKYYGDPGAMEILFVPEIPTQEQLNDTWPGTQEKMHRLVYGHRTHAEAIRYTDPDAMVAAPRLERLFWQEEPTTGQVTVIHHSPTRPNQDPHHRFPYTVVSPVVQVTGQVRFRPLSALDLERRVEDIAGTGSQGLDSSPRRAFEDVRFGYPHHSSYKGLDKVTFPPVPFQDNA